MKHYNHQASTHHEQCPINFLHLQKTLFLPCWSSLLPADVLQYSTSLVSHLIGQFSERNAEPFMVSQRQSNQLTADN